MWIGHTYTLNLTIGRIKNSGTNLVTTSFCGIKAEGGFFVSARALLPTRIVQESR